MIFLNRPKYDIPIYASFYDADGNRTSGLTIPAGTVQKPEDLEPYLIGCSMAIFKQDTGFYYSIKLNNAR
jgi:hypothetical protein